MTTIDSDALPAGEVTLLFTDVEGSTRLWELHASRMPALLAEHDRILAAAVASAGGVLQLDRAEGDSGFAVFADAAAAIQGAIELQRAMAAHEWPDGLRLRTRAALHTGVVEVRGATYYGPVVNRCVKLRSLAHGAQIILSKATVDSVAAAGDPGDGVTFVDLGTHRLKELAVPERVYELRHPDLEAGFPPLRSPDVEQHNLPEIRGRFVGRAQEQREITKALDVERLVTLIGTGGVGKTRLALEVAWSRVAGAHDGTWFADLTGARSDEDVDGIVAAAVGVREQPGRPVVETITDHLGSRNVLVVLDNCEHVVPAARRLVSGILQRCPTARVVATSRELLGLDEERRRAVPGLPVADAVDLFFDRAALDRVALGSDASAAVERLCDRLDGVPFAIEIAAARAEAFGADAIDRGVAVALAEETGRSALEATLAWSFGLLAEEDQVLFRRLGVFTGTFALDAAESVTAFDPLETFDVLDLLDGLVERSLVHRSHAGGYRQLVVAREYAQRLAERAAEAETLAARHLSWCVGLVTGLAGHPDRERFDRLRHAGDDLLSALDRDFDEERASVQVQLAAALEEFWFVRGAFSEGRARLEAVLERGAGFRSHRAVAHRSAGRLAKWQGDLDGAKTHLDRSRALLEEILAELRAGDSPHIPIMEEHLQATLLEMSEVARIAGDAPAALEIAREAFLRSPTPYAALILGMANLAAGQLAESRRLISEALEVASRVSDDRLAARCHRHLGALARLAGELEDAEKHYRVAVALERSCGETIDLAYALVSLAELLTVAGRPTPSVLEEGLALARATGERLAEAHGLSTLAEVTAATDPRAARALHQTALDLRSAVGAQAEVALSRLRVGAFAELYGLLDEAFEESMAAVEIFRDLADDRGAAEGLAQLARLAARRGDLGGAADSLREAVERATRPDCRIERVEILDAAAWLAFRQDKPAASAALLDAAAQRRAQLGIVASTPLAKAHARLRSALGGATAAGDPDISALLDAVLSNV